MYGKRTGLKQIVFVSQKISIWHSENILLHLPTRLYGFTINLM